MSTSTTAVPTPVQDPEIARLLERVARAGERARTLVQPLSEAQLAWAPPGGGWSVGQVLEHLVVSDALYLERMRRALEAAVAAGRHRGVPTAWRGSLFGRLLAAAVAPDSARRVGAPRVFKPGPAARPGVLEAFLATRGELSALLRRADGWDVSRIRLASPVSALVRLNLGDAFRILANHAERHLGQVERVMGEAGFPR